MPRRKLLLPQIPNPKNQIPRKIQNPNNKNNLENRPRRDLEDRTFQFAQAVRIFVETPPRNISNTEDVRQLVRASGSVAANWIEADEALSKKDFLMRLKICRKEAKESRLFLRLIDAGSSQSTASARDKLAEEACELALIFSAIISKSE